MPETVSNGKTSLPPEEVIVRAVQFFTGERWRPQTQSARIATFIGRPRVGAMLWLATVLGLLFFVIPGLILYLVLVRKAGSVRVGPSLGHSSDNLLRSARTP